jgi:hypothetical protein
VIKLFRSPFRQKALDRLSSPEKLDQMVRVIPSRGWLALGMLGGLLVAVLLWGAFASIQTTVSGDGILLSTQHDTSQLEAILYVTIADGQRIRPGMNAQISPNAVQQEEYGLMWGTVSEVHGVPSTEDEMLQVLGNDALVGALNAAGKLVEVHIALSPDYDTPSGYRWTSVMGPPHEIHSGTLGVGIVVVDHQRPIEFVLP